MLNRACLESDEFTKNKTAAHFVVCEDADASLAAGGPSEGPLGGGCSHPARESL